MAVVRTGCRLVLVVLLGLSAVACGSTGPDAFVEALTDEQDIDNAEDRARLLGVGLQYCRQRNQGFDLEVALRGPKEGWPTEADSIRQQQEDTEALRLLMERKLCD